MLRPVKLSRLEVVAPSEKVETIVREVGKLGVAHFIDINATKEHKYKGVASEAKRSPKEETLQQLANRIGNLFKKVQDIPLPSPVPVKEDSPELLGGIEREISQLEVSIAKLENALKDISEEKATLERDITHFYEEYESVKRFFAEYGISPEAAKKIGGEALEYKEKIRAAYARLLDIQRALLYIDSAAKLSTPHERVPNDENALRALRGTLRKLREDHEKIKTAVAESAEELAKIESILKEVEEVVDRKLEALERLRQVRYEALNLNEELVSLQSGLPEEARQVVGRAFLEKVGEVAESLGVLANAEFGSPKLEELALKFSKSALEILRGAEALEFVERFQAYERVKALMDEVKQNRAADLPSLVERYENLSRLVPSEALKPLERSLKILSFEQRVQELAEAPKQIVARLEEIGKSSSTMHAYKEIVDIELKIEELKRFFRETERSSVFEVWVKAPDVNKAVEAIRRAAPEAVVNVSGEEPGDRPPTALKTPRPMKAYEKLVAAYGLPNYHELNPVNITIFTFPVIFGLMFPDIGHGLILVIGGIFIKRIFEKAKLSGPLWDPVVQGRSIILTCGAMAIFFGVLFGEFFGPTTLKNFEEGKVPFALYSWVTGFKDALWFAPLEPPFGPIKMLKIAIIVAAFQLLLGMGMDLVNKISHRDWKETLASASRLWFQASLIFLILNYKFAVVQKLINVAQDPAPMVGLFLLPLIGMIIAHRISTGHMFEGAVEAISRLIEAISNTASYARILAIGMVHAVFSEMALLAGGPLFWLNFIVITLLLLIALNGILAFAHSLRLHWVEWFSKFYSGDGYRFEGFTIQRKFTVAAA